MNRACKLFSSVCRAVLGVTRVYFFITGIVHSGLKNLCLVMSAALFLDVTIFFHLHLLCKQVTESLCVGFSPYKSQLWDCTVCLPLLCYRDAAGWFFAHLSRVHVHQRSLPGAAWPISFLTVKYISCFALQMKREYLYFLMYYRFLYLDWLINQAW